MYLIPLSLNTFGREIIEKIIKNMYNHQRNKAVFSHHPFQAWQIYY